MFRSEKRTHMSKLERIGKAQSTMELQTSRIRNSAVSDKKWLLPHQSKVQHTRNSAAFKYVPQKLNELIKKYGSNQCSSSNLQISKMQKSPLIKKKRKKINVAMQYKSSPDLHMKKGKTFKARHLRLESYLRKQPNLKFIKF